MLYGFVYHFNLVDCIELHVTNYPYHKFLGYTPKRAQKEYRKIYGLKYKKITWL